MWQEFVGHLRQRWFNNFRVFEATRTRQQQIRAVCGEFVVGPDRRSSSPSVSPPLDHLFPCPPLQATALFLYIGLGSVLVGCGPVAHSAHTAS